MTIEELKQQKAALWEQSQAKFNQWVALTQASHFYDVFHSTRDDAMYQKLQADAELIMVEYDALMSQWDAIELQLIALERAVLSEQTKRPPEPVESPAIPKPIYHGQYTTWGMHKYARRTARMDDVIWMQVQTIVDVAFSIVPERAKSWREEIVEEALLEDAS